MGICYLCEKKNDYYFSNDLCEVCIRLKHLIKAMGGSEKIVKSLSVRLKDVG
jgi:hypothetical protein